jgi:hypothetical protein
MALSLVEELQRDALDGSVDVSHLLRKAYVVAVKLKLDKFKSWADFELNGYGASDVPAYREIRGVLRAWNPYNGWIPVFLTNDPRWQEQASIHWERGSVGAIQDLVNNAKDGQGLIARLPPRLQNEFQRGMNVPLEVSLHIGRAGLVAALNAVRNVILDWSLKLEADGILGEGMSFSTEEKQIASNNADELQGAVINIGTMINSSIQQASRKSHLKSAK